MQSQRPGESTPKGEGPTLFYEDWRADDFALGDIEDQVLIGTSSVDLMAEVLDSLGYNRQ